MSPAPPAPRVDLFCWWCGELLTGNDTPKVDGRWAFRCAQCGAAIVPLAPGFIDDALRDELARDFRAPQAPSFAELAGWSVDAAAGDAS